MAQNGSLAHIVDLHLRRCAFQAKWLSRFPDALGPLGECLGALCLARCETVSCNRIVIIALASEVGVLVRGASSGDLRAAFWIAARFGQLDILKQILAAGPGDWPGKWTACVTASSHGHTQVAAHLLMLTQFPEHSTAFHTRTWSECFYNAVSGGHADVARLIIGDTRMRQWLNRFSYDPEDPKINYFKAAMTGCTELNLPWEDFLQRSTSSREEWAPAHELCAVMKRKHTGYGEVVHMLLAFDRRPHILENGVTLPWYDTVLYDALLVGNASVVRTLIKNDDLMWCLRDRKVRVVSDGYILPILTGFKSLSGRYGATLNATAKCWYAEVFNLVMALAETIINPAHHMNTPLIEAFNMAKTVPGCAYCFINVLVRDTRVQAEAGFAQLVLTACQEHAKDLSETDMDVCLDEAAKVAALRHAARQARAKSSSSPPKHGGPLRSVSEKGCDKLRNFK